VSPGAWAEQWILIIDSDARSHLPPGMQGDAPMGYILRTSGPLTTYTSFIVSREILWNKNLDLQRESSSNTLQQECWSSPHVWSAMEVYLMRP
jgi:hypothetical protein